MPLFAFYDNCFPPNYCLQPGEKHCPTQGYRNCFWFNFHILPQKHVLGTCQISLNNYKIGYPAIQELFHIINKVQNFFSFVLYAPQLSCQKTTFVTSLQVILIKEFGCKLPSKCLYTCTGGTRHFQGFTILSI